MISEFSRIPIGYLIIISSFFIVKLTNGEPYDICSEALKKLQLPPDYADSCTPAIIFYERIEGSTKLNVMIESQDNVVIELKDLKRTEGILANDLTPIFITSQEAEDSESHSYPRDLNIMEDIGEFSMYQNFVIKTSCELYKDKSGEQFYGTVGLDTILIGIGLSSGMENENTTYVKGDIAVITVAGGINLFQSKSLPTEVSTTNDFESTGKTAYPELLVVADYTIVKKQTSKVELIRRLFLWFNAADMLFSPLQSPRIHLNIAGILIAENDDSLSYLQKSLAPEGYLRLDKVMRNVEEEFYNKSNILSFECYDYAMVLTGHNICSAVDTECVNGRVSRKPDTVNKSKLYKNRINTASIINTMIALPTQLLITKKISQLMGVKLVGDEDEDKFPGIMEDYSSVSTPLKWAKCSVEELTQFYNLPKADGLWNTPTGCFVEKAEDIWQSSWTDPCEKALTKLQLPKGYVGSCIPVAMSYEKIEGSQRLDLSFQSQDRKMRVLKDLVRTDGTLANNRTSVFIATESSEYDENYQYDLDKNIMRDIGQFSLYRNYAIKTSCELYKDEVGENIYGTVGLDTIFIGIGLGWKIKRHSIEVKGIVALISLVHSKDFFTLEDSPEELSTEVKVSSERDAYAELMLVVDHVLMKNSLSRVDFVRELVLWFNAADMLFSPLQSPRIHLNIAGILLAETDNALSFVQKSLTTDGSLSLNKVMENVEEELYNRTKKLPLDCYDYAIVLTGHNICKRAGTECVNGRVSAHPNTVNKTLRYKNRVNTAAIINIMMSLPTQLLITKKIAQLMGAKLIQDEEEDECPGIMNDYSTVSTPLNWAKCSVNDLRQFSETPEAGGLWNHPRMCLVENDQMAVDYQMAADEPMAADHQMAADEPMAADYQMAADEPMAGDYQMAGDDPMAFGEADSIKKLDPVCELALKMLQLPTDYADSCVPVEISYERVTGIPLLNISIQLHDGAVIELEELERTDGLLANNRTPLFVVSGDPENDEKYSFVRDENVMNDIGDFCLYHNYAIKTSCELYKDETGENIYGAVGLDEIFIGIGLNSTVNDNSLTVRGTAALITLKSQQDIFKEYQASTEMSIKKDVSSEKIAYPKLLLLVDHITVGDQTRVELVRKLLLQFNAVDMLFSPLQSPRVKLHITGIVVAENDDTLTYLHKSQGTDSYLHLNNVMEYLEEEFYKISNIVSLDSYDYGIVLTGYDICNSANAKCVNGHIIETSNSEDETGLYKNHANETAVVNVMMAVPTEILIAKKIGQLMGAKLVREDADKICLGIMDDFSTVPTALVWSNCSVNELSMFFSSSEASKLWNYPEEYGVSYPVNERIVESQTFESADLNDGVSDATSEEPHASETSNFADETLNHLEESSTILSTHSENGSGVTTESEGISTQSSPSDNAITSTEASDTTQSVNPSSSTASQSPQSEEEILVTMENVTHKIEISSTPDEINYGNVTSTDSSLTTEDGYTVTTASEGISTQSSPSDDPITSTEASETTQGLSSSSSTASQSSQIEEEILVTMENVTHKIEISSTPDEIDYGNVTSTDSSLTTEDGYTVTTASEGISTQSSPSDDPITSTEASETTQGLSSSSSTASQSSQIEEEILVTMENVTHKIEISSTPDEIDYGNVTSTDSSLTTEDGYTVTTASEGISTQSSPSDDPITSTEASETTQGLSSSSSTASQSSQSEEEILVTMENVTHKIEISSTPDEIDYGNVTSTDSSLTTEDGYTVTTASEGISTQSSPSDDPITSTEASETTQGLSSSSSTASQSSQIEEEILVTMENVTHKIEISSTPDEIDYGNVTSTDSSLTTEDGYTVTTASEGISTQSSPSDDPITSTEASETTQGLSSSSSTASQSSQSEEEILVTMENVTHKIEISSTPDEIDYGNVTSTDSSLTTEDGYTVTTASEGISTQSSPSDDPITSTEASETTQGLSSSSSTASQSSQSEEEILVTMENVTHKIEISSTPDEIDYGNVTSTDSSLTTEDGYTVTTASEGISTQSSPSDDPITSTEASETTQGLNSSSSTTTQPSQSNITILVTINNVTHEVEISGSTNEIDHRNDASSVSASTTEDGYTETTVSEETSTQPSQIDSFRTSITASESTESVNQSLSIASQSSQSEEPINESKNCTGFNPPNGTLNVPLQYDVYVKANITIVPKTTLSNGKQSDIAKQFLCAFGQIAKLKLCT